MAFELGDDWNQKKISLLEQKETIEPALLQQISTALKIPVEAFQHFDEQQAVNVIANTFTDSFNDSTNAFAYNNNCTFNATEKWLEALEEIKRLHTELLKEKDDKISLYERMLKEKDEMMGRLEKLMKEKM